MLSGDSHSSRARALLQAVTASALANTHNESHGRSSEPQVAPLQRVELAEIGVPSRPGADGGLPLLLGLRCRPAGGRRKAAGLLSLPLRRPATFVLLR